MEKEVEDAEQEAANYKMIANRMENQMRSGYSSYGYCGNTSYSSGSSYCGSTSSNTTSGPLKKDGTPDYRFSANRTPGLNKD